MSSMFSGIGDWLRQPMGGAGAAPGGTPGAAPGGMTRGQGIGQMMAGAGQSLASGGTMAGGMANAQQGMQQQQVQQQGMADDELWNRLKRLIAQRGLPGQAQGHQQTQAPSPLQNFMGGGMGGMGGGMGGMGG